MTTFHDGPAHGKTLMLKRAPVFLRVVIDGQGEIDALNEEEDKPKPDETLYLYLLERKPGCMHVRRKGGGGFYIIAEYRYLPEQPHDDEMRTQSRWIAWVEANYTRFKLPEA